MNNNFEKNNLKKDRGRRRNNSKPPANKFTSDKTIETTERRFKDGGFIAWPQPKLSIKKDDLEMEVIEGRSKKGGFIAFPKIV
ncbi:MAG: hypothetical protein ABI683_06825 [Ginsengibacter sp.]